MPAFSFLSKQMLTYSGCETLEGFRLPPERFLQGSQLPDVVLDVLDHHAGSWSAGAVQRPMIVKVKIGQVVFLESLPGCDRSGKTMHQLLE